MDYDSWKLGNGYGDEFDRCCDYDRCECEECIAYDKKRAYVGEDLVNLYTELASGDADLGYVQFLMSRMAKDLDVVRELNNVKKIHKFDVPEWVPNPHAAIAG